MKLDLSMHLEYFKATSDYLNLNCYDSNNEYLDKIEDLSDDALKCLYLIYFFYELRAFHGVYTRYTICHTRHYKTWGYWSEAIYVSPNNKIRLYVYKNRELFPGSPIEKGILHHLHLNGMILPVDKYMNESLRDLSYLEMLYQHMNLFIECGKTKVI